MNHPGEGYNTIMNVLAFLLALAATICFIVAAARGPERRILMLPLGLAFLTASWIVQFVWAAHRIRGH